MSRLIDDLLQNGKLDDYMRSIISSGQIIKIQNVADYHFQNIMDEYDLRKDFPNVAPPFERAWYEYRLPSVMRSHDGSEYGVTQANRHIGVFVFAARIEESKDLKPWYDDDADLYGDICRKLVLPGWMVSNSIYIKSARDPYPSYIGAMWLPVSGDGVIAADEGLPYTIAKGLRDSSGNPIEATQLFDTITAYVRPVLMALSFLHCKNVTLDGNDIPAKIQKRRISEGKLPLVKYYTLNIEPMRRVLSREGGIEKNGAGKAMHICRGHFADYSKGNGLFGKYKGRYWVDSHVRGSASKGKVIKDYDVKAVTTV